MVDISDYLSPSAFRFPERVAESAWLEHVPFAFWLIEQLNPRDIVELGSYRGVSFLAFCQAVQTGKLATRCFAVDSWKNDLRNGFYGDKIYEELAAYHDVRYGAFSRLVRTTFAQALEHFPDNSIDLLHIEGLHAHEAVEQAFKAWLPKMSSRGVILFHDVNVPDRGSKVYRLWAELTAQYPENFEFFHGHGLGVVAVGQEVPDSLRRFFAVGREEATAVRIREIYARLGKHVSDRQNAVIGQASLAKAEQAQVQLQSAFDKLKYDYNEQVVLTQTTQFQLQDTRTELQSTRTELQDKLLDSQKKLQIMHVHLQGVYSSRAWRLVEGLRACKVLGREFLACLVSPRRLYNVIRKALRLQKEVHRMNKLRRLVAESGLFDSAWYVQQNQNDVAVLRDPIRHFLEVGATLGRDPNPYFSVTWYCSHYPDVHRSSINPLLHFILYGAVEGRRPNPNFDIAWYRDLHPEIQKNGVNPLLHYLTVGREKGFPANCLEVTPFAPSLEIKNKVLADDKIISRLGRAVEVAGAMGADGRTEWRDYETLKRVIVKREKARGDLISVPAVDMIDCHDRPLEDCLGEIKVTTCLAPLVSIIVPVFNEIRMTLECLTSVVRYTGGRIPYELILADDASTDETQSVLEKLANIVYLRNATNLNFLRNCNNAARSARGKYILFLNNDVQVTEGWLDALVATFAEHESVGAVGPKILYPNGRLQEAGVTLNRDGTATLVGLGDDPNLPRYNYAREVDYCSGAALILETERFRALGGFSEELAPAYYEDSDLCLKLRNSGLRIIYNPAAVVAHHMSRTTAGFDSGFKGRCVAINRQKLLEKWQADIDTLAEIRTIAFYLPQYHPFPENDRWWGKGFTEWHNVAKAKPNFIGHYQPHLPADLGYYDLRVPEVMEQQAALAKRYGVSGFCFYYYWFSGKRLLELPIERMLSTGKPDMPFCLCWANENWTRRWDGRDQEILMAQNHSNEDDVAVITDLIRYFRSPNYIRINGKPLLLVYNIGAFPDFLRTAETWRDTCRKEGMGEIYLAFVESFFHEGRKPKPATVGCDASVEFPPHSLAQCRIPSGTLVNPNSPVTADDYREIVVRSLTNQIPDYTRFRGVMPSWDNTPRRGDRSQVIEASSPGAFQAWLEGIYKQTRQQNFGDERIVFINAWNEWAEGAYLEPDRQYGHSYLEAVRNAIDHWQLLDLGADERSERRT